MNHLALFSGEVICYIITAFVCGVTFVGALLGTVIWKARSVYRELENGEKKRVAKSEKEESQVRETLLGRYKEMYEVEKEKSDRDISSLRQEIEKLTNEVRQLRDNQSNLRRENEELRTFNLKLQAQVARNAEAIEHPHT